MLAWDSCGQGPEDAQTRTFTLNVGRMAPSLKTGQRVVFLKMKGAPSRIKLVRLPG